MNTQQIETVARQAMQQAEQAVQRAPEVLQAIKSLPPFDLLMLGIVFGALLLFSAYLQQWKRGSRDSMLDRRLFQWNRDNWLTVRDLVAGGIHVAGGTGSGKTSTFRQVARSILEFGNSSILVMCGKRDEYLDWLALAKETGRSRDVILIDPEHNNCLNLIGQVASRVGDVASVAREVTSFLMTLREVLLRESSQAGGDSEFWKQQTERQTRSAVMLLALANEEISPNNIRRLVLSAPQSDGEMKSDEWKRDYCSQVIQKAHGAAKTNTARHDFEEAGTYMTREWCGLGEKTRASVLMGTMATLSVLNSGMAWKMFGDKTTISLVKAIEHGKIVIVNMPPDVHGDLGRLANTGIKHLWQKEVLRREVTKRSPISVIWGDESSQWVTSFDASYLSRCRSVLGCMVYLTQSLASYRDVMPGERAEASIKALMASFTHKLFFALGDYDTAEYAANLVGKELRMLSGTSTTEAEFKLFEVFPDRPKVTNSFNESFEHIVRPEEFISGLRTGSKVHKFQVDAIIVRFGGLFANGLPVIQATFDQRN